MMKIQSGVTTILMLTLLLCAEIPVHAADKKLTSLLAPYDEWYFNFLYPNALPADVTYAELLDTDGILYRYRMLGSTNASSASVGKWNEEVMGIHSDFNKAKNPPQAMHFCWDSIIDKKVYETWITFGYPVWEMMLTPYPSPWDASVQEYHRYLVIGLAPEGRVRVWLVNNGKPNTRLTEDKDILVETVSGEKLAMCKGVTRFSRGYKYIKETEDFIKDKKYPYGNW
ncbi:hypothetical protein DOE57_16795 [Salmonella enterica subsp. salamae serovar 56:b:[1,5]]|uniref:DUF2931 family protein n=1 Tax=Salmonella enterica subsp. salamae serovar 56:b:[1,5] TaxID=2577858 RepID=A0A6C7DFE0_SALER|nr:DUF2931 family protein [Salmonella enterica]ECI4597895.1 hypothetical protein [Salmonella enterica subsp. salamae]AXC86828.1 hypothetical protein DOE57_16785 [Salmonella enterica subsp. salamae serovar 56:b:[1,5]]AXC86829.1 hypothetical protein DOE57_16790 [Salmonella enterica subsp. salamae serovar 56:b:[1,5]]AXC86830.1 hypothetical protein DOE57_16795 [Salmonella enterica subsp. salamae serovar 56:b:[1,5]]EHJ0757524.1 DUF2931 family protein [Salmonella enterica]